MERLQKSEFWTLSPSHSCLASTGDIIKERLISKLIMLLNKHGTKACGDYRTISLMNHMLKLFLKIIHRIIDRTCEKRVSHTQFGFKKGMGIRDEFFCLQEPPEL